MVWVRKEPITFCCRFWFRHFFPPLSLTLQNRIVFWNIFLDFSENKSWILMKRRPCLGDWYLSVCAGSSFGHVYSIFKMCVSVGVFICESQPLACWRSALCIVHKPSGQQFVGLGQSCMAKRKGHISRWKDKHIWFLNILKDFEIKRFSSKGQWSETECSSRMYIIGAFYVNLSKHGGMYTILLFFSHVRSLEWIFSTCDVTGRLLEQMELWGFHLFHKSVMVLLVCWSAR